MLLIIMNLLNEVSHGRFIDGKLIKEVIIYLKNLIECRVVRRIIVIVMITS